MKLASLSILRLLTCAAFVLTVFSARAEDAKKADPTGTWAWTTQGRNGGEGREIVLKIKKDGEKYAGTMSGARGGAETKLDHVKVDGDQLSFSVTREFNGNSFTSKYSGKVAGDSLTGKIEMEREGQTRSRDWAAKRKKD